MYYHMKVSHKSCFKGTIIYRLYEEGKLDLDKPVAEYVKSWPNKHPPISVRQIASHTSGIRHYKENPDSDDTSDHDTKYPEFYSNVPYKEIEDALEVFKNDDLLSEPGMYLLTKSGKTKNSLP